MNKIAFSVYLSSFLEQKAFLEREVKAGEMVFICLHLGEEYESIPNYSEKMQEMCNYLKSKDYLIVADVSRHTLDYFQVETLLEIRDLLHIDYFRIDYGFSEEEVRAYMGQIKLCLNAITAEFIDLESLPTDIIAMHNYYPRPETGLSAKTILPITRKLQAQGVSVSAFIAGDQNKRLPLFLGLPTLEEQRYYKPYLAYAEMIFRYQMDTVIIGDLDLSSEQMQLIRRSQELGLVLLPAQLENKNLYEQDLTVRFDSPEAVYRVVESREYACAGEKIEPSFSKARLRGSICQDNLRYDRYSGEIMLIREDLAPDHRVNVIGRIEPDYLALLDCLQPGAKFRLIDPALL